MQIALAPVFAFALIGGADVPTEHTSSLIEQYKGELRSAQALPKAVEANRVEQALRAVRRLKECRDRVMSAREDAGLSPLLNREPASPEKPYAIYAVDRRQEGCSVMLMMGTRDDIRPLPGPAEGSPFLLIPAQDGKR